MKKKLLTFSLWAGAILAGNLILTGCNREAASGQKKNEAKSAVPVVIGKAVAKSMPVQVRAIGNVQPYSTVMVRSQVTGQLAKVHFDEGQEVKEGDILFTIDQRPFAGMLEQAKANLARDTAQLDSARLTYERELKLSHDGLISQDEFEKAEAAFKSLQGTILADRASISNATLNLEFTTIRSAINGRTGNLLAHAGNIVKAPDDQLLAINQVQPIYVSFAVPEQFLPEIRKRLRETKLMVSAAYANMDAAAPQGELTFIDNSVDFTTGTIQLKATFPNRDNLLWPGQFVQAMLLLNEQANSVVVPSQAIQNGQNGEFIYVVKADQSVEFRRVETGIIEKGETVILNGVKAGETVVIDGQSRLVPGAKITTKQPVGEEPLVKQEADAQ